MIEETNLKRSCEKEDTERTTANYFSGEKKESQQEKPMLLQKISKFLSSLILIFRDCLLTSKKLNFPELDGLHPKILNEIVNDLAQHIESSTMYVSV